MLLITLIISILFGVFVPLIGFCAYVCFYQWKHLSPDEWDIQATLLKKRQRKSDVIYLFKNINTCKECIIKLKKIYLNKLFIPNEFLIEKSPKKEYYKYLKETLQENETYFITFGDIGVENKPKKILLSAKEIT